MLTPIAVFSQKEITGKVFDATSSKPLVSASVVDRGNKKGVTSSNDGSFKMSVDNNTKTVTISYVGYETQTIRITNNNTAYFIGLQPLAEETAVTVIGSRNLARTKVQTPVPVDVIPVRTIAKQVGQVDLNQLLTYVTPSFQSTRQTTSDGTDHQDPAHLRGLGSDQVLVLVNGKRRHQSALVNVNGTINRGQVGTDLNAIPLSSIDRVEVLRDGASAQYGSDAFAGVINIVLKKNVNSLSGNVSVGQNNSRYSRDYAFDKASHVVPGVINIQDGNMFQAGLNYGIDLNKKGFINLSGEYSLRNSSNRAGTYTGAVYANVNNANKDDSILNARGKTRNDFDMRIGNSRISNGAFTLNGAYSLNSNWKLVVFGTYSNKSGEGAGIFRYPSAITANAGSYASQTLAIYPNGFLPLIQTSIKDYSFSAGLEGKLGSWHASLTNTLGYNSFNFEVVNSINYTQFAATPNPQSKFNAGGLNFLQNTVNADMVRNFKVLNGLNVAYGAEFRLDQFGQRAGEEASYKNYNTASGAASGAQVFAGFVPDYARQHSRTNVGFYADVEQDFTKQLLVGIALRSENYSDFGSTLNYKLTARYKLGDRFTVRAGVSTGFRAPSMQQKYYAKTNTIFVSTPAGLVPTESGTFTNDSKPAQILGIPKLKEETSQNYSLGFTTSPAPGLDISVDGYLVNIENRIVLTNNFTGGTNANLAQLLKDNGATSANFFTNAIDTKAKGIEAVANYRIPLANQSQLKFTLAATFIKNEVKKGTDGKPAIKASDILLSSGQIGNYFNREDQSRFEVANPDAKGNFTVNYNIRRFSAMVRLAYFGKVVYLDPSINPLNPDAFPVNTFTGQKETLDQEFSAKTITDLSVSYDLVRNFTLTVGSNNVFDIYPDKHNHSVNVSTGRFIYSRRVNQMGFNGRYIFARISFNISSN